MSRRLKCATGLVLAAFAATAGAEAPPQKPSVEDLTVTVEALKAKLQDYENRIAELENRAAKTGMSKDEVAALIREMNADAAKRSALPNWMENLKFGGDLRLRYQGESYSGANPNDKDRNRARYRLRFGVTKTFLDDQLEVGFRLASGEDGYKNAKNDPATGYSPSVSTNQTFTKFFTQKPIWVDLAYAKYTPNWLKGFTLVGGKMKKEFVHTDLVWDSDVNPEGVWAQYKLKACESWSPFVNAGYFIVDESAADHDVTLWMTQVGSELNITKDVQWVIAGTVYDYKNMENANVYGNGNHQNSGGAYLAEGFQMINLTNQVKWKLLGLPWAAYFDWVHNYGDEDSANPYEDQSDGYAVGLTVGQNKKKGDWSAGYKYAYIEANSTPGAFNDADFGSANRKGHVWRAAYNLTDFLEIGANVFFTEPVVGSHENDRTVLVQGDLVWKF